MSSQDNPGTRCGRKAVLGTHGRAHSSLRHRLAVSLVVLAGVYVLSACASGQGAPSPHSTGAETATTATRPAATQPTASTAAPSASTTASPSQSPVGKQGSSATFEHFKVTVDGISYTSESRALVHAKVCVRSLPPNPQGDRTRISWDPWSVTAGTEAAKAGNRGESPAGMFPSDRTYKVGQCASGVLPFVVEGEVDTVRYANGVGDKAIWDADNLDRDPVEGQGSAAGRADSRDGIGEGTFIVGDDITPGRYKAEAKTGVLCYWARLKDDSGEFDSIIANNATRGKASVTIKESDGAFETSGCTPWVRQ